eukprot:7070975-Prymnesium_polylepis.1
MLGHTRCHIRACLLASARAPWRCTPRAPPASRRERPSRASLPWHAPRLHPSRDGQHPPGGPRGRLPPWRVPPPPPRPRLTRPPRAARVRCEHGGSGV